MNVLQRIAIISGFLSSALLGQGLPIGQLPDKLTRQDAERIALANNPRIHVTQLLAKAQQQVIREIRAGELPTLSANITGVETNGASRIGAGTLNVPRLAPHVGTGLVFNQLITDFGRTRNLIASESLREKARQADVVASEEDIILVTDEAFYHALEAQATLRIADQTVATRQTLVDKVTALTNARLKSTLDLSFAQVDLSRAKLLQLDARNNIDSAMAALTAVLGFDRLMNYRLDDDTGDLPPLPSDARPLVTAALGRRPDLQALQLTAQAAEKYTQAQRAQLLPTISALGIVGVTPVGSSLYFTPNWYGAVGLNIGVPIFDGFRYRAEASEAALQSRAAMEQTRERRDQVVREVESAWLNANTALQRLTVAAELVKEASLATDLAQSRYNLGLGSIVELSQAQLQQTAAAIGDANARTQYRLAIAALRARTGNAF